MEKLVKDRYENITDEVLSYSPDIEDIEQRH